MAAGLSHGSSAVARATTTGERECYCGARHRGRSWFRSGMSTVLRELLSAGPRLQSRIMVPPWRLSTAVHARLQMLMFIVRMSRLSPGRLLLPLLLRLLHPGGVRRAQGSRQLLRRLFPVLYVHRPQYPRSRPERLRSSHEYLDRIVFCRCPRRSRPERDIHQAEAPKPTPARAKARVYAAATGRRLRRWHRPCDGGIAPTGRATRGCRETLVGLPRSACDTAVRPPGCKG